MVTGSNPVVSLNNRRIFDLPNISVDNVITLPCLAYISELTALFSHARKPTYHHRAAAETAPLASSLLR